MDTTQSSVTRYLKMYVNGVEQILEGTVWTQNVETLANSTNTHYIGSQGQASSYLDAYLAAELTLLTVKQLAPTDFGEYDSNNNWNLKIHLV